MEKNLQEILNDLFMIDPDLRSKEKEIIPIVEALLKAKPDTKFDENFAKQLRARLLVEADSELLKKSSFINNLFFMKKLNYFALSLAAIILIVGGFYVSQKKVPNMNIVQTGKQDSKSYPEELLKQIQEAPLGSPETKKNISQIRKFASKEEFVKFLENSPAIAYGRGGGGIGGGPETLMAAPSGMGESSAKSAIPQAADNAAGRISQTNVQVLGIDEPDIVKTDGKNLFVSSQQFYPYYGIMDSPAVGMMPIPESKVMPYRQPQEITNIISAFPADALKKIGKIDKQGDMLLFKDTLVIFSYEYVYGFDIKDKTNPKEAWKIKYENNSSLVTARLYDGKLFLVTRNFPDFSNPCPIRPFSLNGKNIEIACTDIYHPIVPIMDTTAYSAFAVDITSGEIKNKLSFVGSSGQAVVYMSQSSLYITYSYTEDQAKILIDFLKTSGEGIFPDTVISKIEKLNTYDISVNSKMMELQQITERYLSSIDYDERVKKDNELQNKMNDYIKLHKRDILFTGVVKIPLSKFEITDTGSVPGMVLNQFSLDEYKGNLRVAVTVGGSGVGMWGGWNSSEQANDVYVLDGSLKTVGSVKDLGKEERIYSARFIEDRGYLVTFRQTDPFYVLDLSDPKNPVMKGELKIPGFSSYLHPLAQNLILGVGQEAGKVKLSLFEVSNASSPAELDKYLLDEYWTDVSSTHHAFLQDKDHGIFFLPGGNNGYIFSYKGNKLNLEKAVSKIQAKRALYINDILYIVGSDKIVTVDEKTWERVGEMGL